MALNAMAYLTVALWPTPAGPFTSFEETGPSGAWLAILALSLVRSSLHAAAGHRAGRSRLGVGPLVMYGWAGIALSIPVALLARAEFMLDGPVTFALAAGLAAWPAVVLLVARGALVDGGTWPPAPPQDRGLVGLGLFQQVLPWVALPLWASTAVGWYMNVGGEGVLGPLVITVAALFLVRIGFGFAFGRALAALDPRRIAQAGRRYRASARAALAAGIGGWSYLVWLLDGVPFQLQGMLGLIGLHLWSEVIVSTVSRARPAPGAPEPMAARDAGLAAVGLVLLVAGAFDLVAELGAIQAGEPGTGQARLPVQLEVWFTASWNGLAGSVVMLAAGGALIRLPDRFRWPVLLFVAVEGAEVVHRIWMLFQDAAGPDGIIWDLVLIWLASTHRSAALGAMLVALAIGGLVHAARRRPAAAVVELAHTFD